MRKTVGKEGEYRFLAFLYETEARYPRLFCMENEYIEQEMIAVTEENGCFYLVPKDKVVWEKVWYMSKNNWIEAQKKKKGYRLPNDIFTYTTDSEIHIPEGNAFVAFTMGQEPEEKDIRELNVHILPEKEGTKWKNQTPEIG